jgi:prepilin-type N-terminal cleavage/methylation domain-containing protein
MIARLHRRFWPRPSAVDSGLTLIEVMAAVVIITVVALASAGFSIQGIKTSTGQQRSQVAVTIANSAMETVAAASIAVNTTTTPSVSGLYFGRYAGDVTNAFNNNSTMPGVAQTYPAWDPNPLLVSGNTPAIPIVSTPAASTTNNTAYTVTTLIGPCYELSLQSGWPATGPVCTKLTGQATPPATVPAGYTQLIRAIVIVNWTAGSTCTGAGGCNYVISTLLAPETDPEWITGG